MMIMMIINDYESIQTVKDLQVLTWLFDKLIVLWQRVDWPLGGFSK